MIEVHKGYSRGKTDAGWLQSRHSFSFGNYINPKRMQFGSLRVLNDDIVAPGKGFDTHEHDNFEIVSIVLSGALAHADSMENEGQVRAGEVQRISAGTGIAHSEYNASKTEPVHFLQIWVKPKLLNTEPSYEQKRIFIGENALSPIVSQSGSSGVSINADAIFLMGTFDIGKESSFVIPSGQGAYVFLLEGAVTIGAETLQARDAAAITEEETVTIYATHKSKVLVVIVPI